MPSHPFKLGIFLNELQLPLDEGLEEANELGVDFVWFTGLPEMPPVAELSDAEADDIQRRIEASGLEHMKVSAGSPFKFLDLTEVTVDTLEDHEEFKADFQAMVRSMELANRFGVGAVSVYSFAWPGEYSADKPTWPMRWMTRGGIISDVEMDKLVKAYTLMVEQGRKARCRSRPVHDALELHEHDRQLPARWPSASAPTASRSCGARRTTSTAGRTTCPPGASSTSSRTSSACTSRTCGSTTA